MYRAYSRTVHLSAVVGPPHTKDNNNLELGWPVRGAKF